MYIYLRNLSSMEQIGTLFVVVFGVLVLASLLLFLFSIRDFADADVAQRRRANVKSFQGIAAHQLGDGAGVLAGLDDGQLGGIEPLRPGVLLCVARVFDALAHPPGDHRSLVLAFFAVLPTQYWLVGSGHFDMFAVFIPVYAFLALPVVSALANDPQRFLERNAKLQWGIMVCVYGMSHVPALLPLDFPSYDRRNAFMVFFLVIVVQVCMVTQHLAVCSLEAPPGGARHQQQFPLRAAPAVGMLVASLLGAALAGITPWVPATAFVFSLIACCAGTSGTLS